jgi:glycosyltransferase involved in cell wall biosynthesis
MQQEPLRVMQIVANLQIGGGQEVVRTLVENLAECGCVPIVCAFEDGPLRKDIEQLGIAVEILPDKSHSIVKPHLFMAEMLRIRRTLIELIDKHKIDVVQTQLLRVMDLLVLTLKLNRRVLVFWTFQNVLFTLRADHLQRHKWLLGAKRAAYRTLYRAASRWVNGFIAVSNDVKSALLTHFGPIADKISVIYNSVDARRYQLEVDKAHVVRELGLPSDALVVAVVATFKLQKGHRYLIEALPAVITQFPKVHLLFIGDGEQRDALQTQVERNCVDKHVHFMGFRQDIPQLLAASNFFVLPSLWEGLPMALIEAMASGLPVIATAVSGSKQVVVDGESGLLVAPGNATQLEQALVRLLSNPELAQALGRAAQARVATRFGAKKQAEEHIALFLRELEKDSQVKGTAQSAGRRQIHDTV